MMSDNIASTWYLNAAKVDVRETQRQYHYVG